MWRATLVSLAALALCGCRRTQTAIDRLHPCTIDEGPTEAFCGRYDVYEKRDARAGRKISLKIVLAPALRGDPQPDPLFIFEGGPGDGAVTLAEYRIPMFRRFQTDRDIVLIDQRGTGASNPLDCRPFEHDSGDLLHPADPPARYRACLATRDADVRFYTTPIAMDNGGEVRRYFGCREINLWGGSYGTRAALIYLRRHGDAVRSVVLDAVDPPEMRLPLFMARDGQRALDHLLSDCGADAVCARSYPHLDQSVEALLAKAAGRPVVSIPHPRTGRAVEIPLCRDLVSLIQGRHDRYFR